MNLQDHIEYIRNRTLDAIAHGDEMNSAIFEDGHGLIMTFNEAIEIVNEIDRLKAGCKQLEKENAELLEALKEVLATGINGGNNVRLAYISASHKELSPESLYKAHLSEMAVLKACAAIENAEKTKQ